MRYTHDIPLAELDGQHAKSIDCPCGTDVEQVTPNSAIVYHQKVEQAPAHLCWVPGCPRCERARCDRCGGRGSWVVWGWSNYGPSGEYGRDQRRTCPDCKGTGRR